MNNVYKLESDGSVTKLDAESFGMDIFSGSIGRGEKLKFINMMKKKSGRKRMNFYEAVDYLHQIMKPPTFNLDEVCKSDINVV